MSPPVDGNQRKRTQVKTYPGENVPMTKGTFSLEGFVMKKKNDSYAQRCNKTITCFCLVFLFVICAGYESSDIAEKIHIARIKNAMIELTLPS